MNKFITLILSAVLTLAITACGGATAASTEDPPPAGPTRVAPTFTLPMSCHVAHPRKPAHPIHSCPK